MGVHIIYSCAIENVWILYAKKVYLLNLIMDMVKLYISR